MDMLKNLFKKEVEAIIPCACDGDNEHCDLILQLRKYQGLRKEINNEIKVLNKDSHELLRYFIEFLMNLEQNGVRMNPWDKWMTIDIGTAEKVQRTIDAYSSDDVFRMTEELRVYKNRADIICEKQRALKAVEDDIKNIKSKLGIE